MVIFGNILFYVGLIALVVGFTFLAIRVRKLAKAPALEVFDLKKESLFIGLYAAIFIVGVTFFFTGFPFIATDPKFFKFENMLPYEWVLLILGALTFATSIAAFYISFRLHYYQKGFSEKFDKKLYITLICSIPLMVGTFLITTEGFANHLIYPVINGISFNPFGFTTAKSGHPNLAFYAIAILSGAILVYFLADHRMYQEFGKHGLLESTFFIAFPAGILGARIFFVAGNWYGDVGSTLVPFSERVANGEWWSIFAIWEGGLTILGGAIVGIAVGVLWFVFRHRDINPWKTVDIVIPLILLAQAIGRFGNFFNAEVHGELVNEAYFYWVPTIFRHQMTISSASGAPVAPEGMIYAPLFYVEALVNITGFLIMWLALPKFGKSFIKESDMFGGYMIWYGLTRTFMEPLRYGAFNMGKDGGWSWIWSIIFAMIGVIYIAINHIVRYYLSKKKDESTKEVLSKRLNNSSLFTLIYGILSVAIFSIGICLFTSFDMPLESSAIALVPHNIGMIMFIVGIGLLVGLVASILGTVDLRIRAKNA